MDWKGILGGVAPVIAGSLGGPFAASATKFLADKLLGNESASDDELEAAIIGATPEQLANIRKIDNDFKIQMAELGFKVDQLHAHDRDSARNMAIKKGMTPQIILSIGYTVGYFAMLYQFMSGEVIIAAQTKDAFMLVLGVMTTAQVQIMNFWFGSSSGSKDKTDRLASG